MSVDFETVDLHCTLTQQCRLKLDEGKLQMVSHPILLSQCLQERMSTIVQQNIHISLFL